VRPLGAALGAVLCGLVLGAVPASAAPTASFAVPSGALHPGVAVTFTSVTATGDPGVAVTQAWNYGDGTTGTPASHTYSAPGTYTVTLTVTDANNLTATASHPVTIVAVNVAPVAGFRFGPGTPVVGQAVAFTSTSTDTDGGIVSTLWDLDGDGLFDDASGTSVSWPYTAFGAYSVGLLVRDTAGAETAFRRTVVVDQPPTASFTPATAVVAAGDTLTLTSTSTDADGRIAGLSWDLDGNGTFGDATTGTVSHLYPTPGVVTVRLQVTDDRNVTTTATGQVTVVADKPPLASFGYSPAAPVAGQSLTFTSQSTDPDGTIAALAWDLDGDGQFDDAAGPTASHAFPAAGQYMVSLRATDDRGATSVAFQAVAVRGTVIPHDAPAAPQPGISASGAHPPGSSPSPGTSLMNPFPLVHIRGQVFGSRVKIDLLSVRAPRGATVRVRCRGRGCPRRTMVARAVSAVRSVRMRGLERRYAAGAVIEVFVTARGHVGKYVRFTIRRGAAPARQDLCITPNAKRPSRCPSA
jgi:PKD repeat protein